MEAPPVVLLAASDGTVSIHYCSALKWTSAQAIAARG